MKGSQLTAFMDIKIQLVNYVEKIAPRAGFNTTSQFVVGEESAELVLVFTTDEQAEFNTKEAREFKSLATLYGLTPEHLGKEYKSAWADKRYTLIGMNRRSTKYPALGRDTTTGKIFKTPMPTAAAFNNK